MSGMEGREGREGLGRPDGGDDRFEDDDWIERVGGADRTDGSGGSGSGGADAAGHAEARADDEAGGHDATHVAGSPASTAVTGIFTTATGASAAKATAGSTDGAAEGIAATDDVAGYAAAVRAELDDLPAAAVADLLEDLEDHLREVAAEDTGDLRERLGTPAAYAAELRASAGLPERDPASPTTARPGRRRRSLADRLAELERRLRTQWLGREVLDFLPLLRPAWWIVRAWLLVVLLQMLTVNDGRGQIGFIPRPGDSQLLGMLLLVLAIPASIWLTRRPPLQGRRARLFTAAQSLLGVFAVVVFLHGVSDDGFAGNRPIFVGNGYPGAGGLSENGTPITNLYVYDKDGKLLTGVYVYDQSGNPVQAAPDNMGDEATQYFVDVNDTFVVNRYPQLVSRLVYGNDGSQHLVPVGPPVVQLPSGVRPADDQGLPLEPTTPAPAPTLPTEPTDTPGTPSPSGSSGSSGSSAPTSPAATSPTPSATPSGSRS